MLCRLIRRLPIAVVALAACCATAGGTIIQRTGSSFTGGGGALVDHHFRDELNVNVVYGKEAGDASRMRTRFDLSESPAAPMWLQLRGMDDDAPGASQIRLTINGTTFFAGANPFPEGAFMLRRFAIPAAVLRAGPNELTIAGDDAHGEAGRPPWCMVSSALIAPLAALPPIDTRVVLPAEKRPFPEPATQPDAPRFKLRGTKGWAWTTQQYLEEIPYLKRANMNFLMNCYFSLFDGETPPGRGWDTKLRHNDWWKPFDETRKRELRQIVDACRANDITFCFAMHPQLFSSRPLDLNSDADFEAFFGHFAWMQEQGVKWFSISMDDVRQEHAAVEHATFCNKFLQRLRQRDPEAQLIFCPTVYANSMIKGHEDYLPTLARDMNPDIYIFWTGADVVPLTMSVEDARTFQHQVRHRIIIWDNYPVNDNAPTLHLGAITGRDPDLCKIADGYIANAMYPQSHANRIPLYTMADFAANPYGYDPDRSIGQAILHLAEQRADQELLATLATIYTSQFAFGTGNTGFNPVIDGFRGAIGSPSSAWLTDAYVDYLAPLSTKAASLRGFGDIATQLSHDISSLRMLRARLAASPTAPTSPSP